MGAAECDAGGQEEPFCPPFGSIAPVIQVIERVQDVLEEALFCLAAGYRLILTSLRAGL